VGLFDVRENFEILKEHQQRILFNEHRHRVVVAGRRFGKTVLAIMVLCASATRFRRSKNWYVAPTRVMAKDIAWDELKAWLHIDSDGTGNHMVRDVSETELTITFTNGSTISLKGAAEPDRLRGRGLKCVVLDEYADMEPGVWTVLRPQLSDIRMEIEYGELGRALFIGSPKGFNHFKKLYDDVRLNKMGDDWMAWKFTSLEGGNISANEIEKAKFDLAERDYRQEYLATFESIQGRIYHAFNREFWPNGNLDNSIHDPGPGLPISVGMDMNVNPMTAVLGSKRLVERKNTIPTWDDDGEELTNRHYEFHVWKEYVLHNSNTAEMMKAIRLDYPDRHLIVFPDPSGDSRKTSAPLSETDYTIIRSFRADVFTAKFNTNSDKYTHVNGMLCNTQNIRRLMINPHNCPKLIDSLDGLQYKDGTNLPDKDSGFDHETDALSYAVIGLFPIAVGYGQVSTVTM
jgi:hypothetical protein